MGGVFPEIKARQKHIEETLKREEEAFNRTLDRGIELFEERATLLAGEMLALGEKRVGHPNEMTAVIQGDFAFQLYDTFGFPLDLTELLARERGLTVLGFVRADRFNIYTGADRIHHFCPSRARSAAE